MLISLTLSTFYTTSFFATTTKQLLDATTITKWGDAWHAGHGRWWGNARYEFYDANDGTDGDEWPRRWWRWDARYERNDANDGTDGREWNGRITPIGSLEQGIVQGVVQRRCPRPTI
jgi:hypothetical protein